MEMNNNGQNETVNDETTSENSMIPQTSQKVGRKIVFMNENEIPYKKYRIESESEEEVIEEENKNIDKLKSTIKGKSKKTKKKKLKKKCKQQKESESNTEISSSIFKYFKLDKYYFPGNKFQSTFIGKNIGGKKKKKLKKRLGKCLENIENEFENLTGKRMLKMQDRKIKLPCIWQSCRFEGLKLKGHLMSKSHQCTKETAQLADSFLHSKIKHICLVNKHGIPKPAICPDCNICIARIDSHLINRHQITRDSETFKKEIKKCREFSRDYEQNFHSIVESNDNDSDSLRSNDNDSNSDNKFRSDEDHGKIRADISTSTKIFNPTTKKADEYSNLPKSSTPLVRLRGANPTITPADYEQNTILIYKKTFNKRIKEKIWNNKS